MKIVEIEVIHIKVPLKRPYKLSKIIGTVESTEPIIVRIITDEGIIGIGETDPLIPFTEESPEVVKICLKETLGPALLGVDPTNIAELHRLMDNILKQNLIAKAAIDIACYDIFGKKTKLPIYKLLGGNIRSEIPISGPLGCSLEETAGQISEYLKMGINTVMIKTGSVSLEEDILKVKIARETAPQMYLLVDANQGWDRSAAIKFGKSVEKYNIEFLEQPVPYWDIEGLAKIRESINIPISVDETIFTIHDAVRVIEKKAADIFSIKVAKNGGIYKAKQIVNLAKAFGIKCRMNSMIEEGITQAASLQLGVCVENILESGHAYFSSLRLKEDISTFSNQIHKGIVKIHNKPGLGIDIREDILEKYVIDVFRIKK